MFLARPVASRWFCALLLWTSAGFRPAGAEFPPPNIVLLESDDHHYQALGCMGDPVRTPNIDALAARGVLFRNNVSQGTMCAPSRNALLTGSYPHNTGVYDNRDGNMTAGVWTFPQALQRAGYRTALVGKNHFKPHSSVSSKDRTTGNSIAELRTLGFAHVHAITGKVAAATGKLGPGQDAYRDYLREKGELKKLEQDYAEHRANSRSNYVGPSALAEQDYQDAYIASRAIEAVRSSPADQPLFLWVDFVAPHPPADAPEPYASMYDWTTMRSPLKGETSPATRRKVEEDDTYRKFRAAYYGMITLLDKQVGRIVDALRETGRLDNTVVVFVGDQGSMMGDLGLWGKGVFYKGSINSPLIIAGPKQLVRHRTEDRPVQIIDLAATFLEWGGASAEDRAHCRGESLGPLLAGTGEPQRKYAFAESAKIKMIVGTDFKYVSDPAGPLLFDLQADPNELVNLAGKRPNVERRLQQRLQQWLKETGPELPPNETPGPHEAKPTR